MLTKNLLTYSKLYKYLNFSHSRIQDCMAEWSRAWNTDLSPSCAVVRNSLPPVDIFCKTQMIFFSRDSQDCPGFKSRPEMPIFQQPSAAMPPMPGGLYGVPEYPQGTGELRKVAEIALN